MKSSDLQKWGGSKKLMILVVSVALGLDNIILTVIVPILPALLYEIDNSNQSENKTELSYHHNPETVKSLNETTHNRYVQESAKVGFMLASKSILQLIANPIVGPLTYKVGYFKPMFVGFVIMFTSTLIFAFGRSYPVLFFARAFQGIGSSCSSVAGLGLLAQTFPDDDERAKAMAIAFSGLSLGIICGPPFGGIMYQLVNKTAPYLIICFFTLIDGCLLLFAMQTNAEKEIRKLNPPSILALIKDKYILLTAGGIFIINCGMSCVESGLSIWMLDTMNASQWETGVALVPCTIFYLVGVNIYQPVLKRSGKWLGSLLSVFLFGVSFVGLSMMRNKIALMLPLAAAGLFCGTTEITLFPELGRIVDIRYASVYGNVYAIGDFALCLAFAIGPILCGTIVNSGIPYDRVILVCGIVCILFSPLMVFLKVIDKEEEKKPLINS